MVIGFTSLILTGYVFDTADAFMSFVRMASTSKRKRSVNYLIWIKNLSPAKIDFEKCKLLSQQPKPVDTGPDLMEVIRDIVCPQEELPL